MDTNGFDNGDIVCGSNGVEETYKITVVLHHSAIDNWSKMGTKIYNMLLETSACSTPEHYSRWEKSCQHTFPTLTGWRPPQFPYKSLQNDEQNPSSVVPHSCPHSSYVSCVIAFLLEKMWWDWLPTTHVVAMPSRLLFLVCSYRPYCQTYQLPFDPLSWDGDTRYLFNFYPPPLSNHYSSHFIDCPHHRSQALETAGITPSDRIFLVIVNWPWHLLTPLHLTKLTSGHTGLNLNIISNYRCWGHVSG